MALSRPGVGACAAVSVRVAPYAREKSTRGLRYETSVMAEKWREGIALP